MPDVVINMTDFRESKNVLSSAAVLALVTMLGATPAVAENGRYPGRGKTDAEIGSIEGGLKPLVVVKNRPGRDFSLLERMKYYKIPGVSIAVIRGGKLAWAKGYGMADVETGRRVDEVTLFRAASISKPVTAAAALRLVEQGVLLLDAPANQQLTSWQIPGSRFTRSRSVTLRHLLSHSGGLSDDPDLSYRQDQAIPTLTQILDGVVPAKSAPVSVDTVPGVTERYSNQGYCIVQLMMSDATGRPFPDLMEALVLEPAGMTRSTFRQQLPERLLAQVATGYRSTGEELPGKRLLCPAMGAAGLWTTPSDLARFILSIIRSVAGDEGALLKRETAEEMLTPRIKEFGLGLSLEGTGRDLAFSHGGASDGYRCFMLAYPARGEGAVIMTNSEAGQGLYLEILRGMASEYGWSSFMPVEKTVVPVDMGHMKEFEGVYSLDGRVELRFSIDKDHLLMKSPSNSYRLFPESSTRFFDIDYGFTIDFIRDESGAVKEALLDRGGVLSTLSRVE